MQKLSVISTLVEAFWLGWARRRLILLLAIFTSLPSMLSTVTTLHLAPLPPATPPSTDPAQVAAHATQAIQNSLLIGAFSLVFVVILFFVTAINTACLLGVLKHDPSPADFGPTIKQSIRDYMWPFIILSLLLTAIAFVFMIPFSILIAVFGFATLSPGKGPAAPGYFIEFMVMLMAILYLIFVKYALANPVIVLENKRPVAALEKSWQMTRGFFWYVLGCYVFLGTAEYAIDALSQKLQSPTSFNWVTAIRLLFDSVLQLYWLLVAWCMYHRIKAAEGSTAAAAPDATN